MGVENRIEQKERMQNLFLRTWQSDRANGQPVGHLDYVKECVVKVMLIPNVLDIDILWALSRTPQHNFDIFTRLPVQAIINGMWTGLCLSTYIADYMMRSVELIAVILVTVANTESFKHFNINMHTRTTWTTWILVVSVNLLCAAVFKEFIMISCWTWNYWAHGSRKRKKGQRVKDMLNLDTVKNYSAMWAFKNFLLRSLLPYEVIGWLLLVFLVISLLFYPVTLKKTPMVTFVYVLNLFTRSMTVVRLSCTIDVKGKRVIAIMQTASAASVLEMVMVSLLFGAMFFVAAQSLQEHLSWSVDLVKMYRILFFADGDMLEDVGLDVLCGEAKPCTGLNFVKQSVNSVFLTGSTFFFNIMILNLLIAVFGNEYDRRFLESTKDFMAAKACFSCKYYFMLSLFKNIPCAKLLPLVWFPLLIFGLAHAESRWLSIFLLALGEVLLLAWTRHGSCIDLGEKSKFLWWFHPLAGVSDNYEESEDAIKANLHGVATAEDVASIEGEVNEFIKGVNSKLQMLETEVGLMAEELDKACNKP